MRIDKFLKVSRLIKRREVAKELCDDGDVTINGKTAKPMSDVNEGDEVSLTLGKRIIEIKIKEIRQFATKEQAMAMFEIISNK